MHHRPRLTIKGVGVAWMPKTRLPWAQSSGSRAGDDGHEGVQDRVGRVDQLGDLCEPPTPSPFMALQMPRRGERAGADDEDLEERGAESGVAGRAGQHHQQQKYYCHWIVFGLRHCGCRKDDYRMRPSALQGTGDAQHGRLLCKHEDVWMDGCLWLLLRLFLRLLLPTLLLPPCITYTR
ncbi:hypothetical protein VTO42DRAFT_4102 [Malbranchea cinnamomea]